MLANWLPAQAVLLGMLVIFLLVDIVEGGDVVKLLVLVRLFHRLRGVQLLLGLRLLTDGLLLLLGRLGRRALLHSIVFFIALGGPWGVIALL